MQPYLSQNNVPGAIVGASLHGRRYFFSYGQATDAGAPFTADTLVEIGSCTKTFTATLFALAVNRNQSIRDSYPQKGLKNRAKIEPRFSAANHCFRDSCLQDSAPQAPQC
jgi:hypothetical protein